MAYISGLILRTGGIYGVTMIGTGGANAVNTSLPSDLKPWQRIRWHACAQAGIFNDWGQYYNRRLLHKEALKSYDRALDVCHEEGFRGKPTSCTQPSNTMPMRVRQCYNVNENICRKHYLTLLKRAQCERALANPNQALLNAIHSQKLTDNSGIDENPEIYEDIMLEQCDALFDCNRFEDNLLKLHTEANGITSINNKERLGYRLSKTLAVFDDTLGDTLGSFFKNNFTLIQDVDRNRKILAAFVPRPLWKEMREQNKCDVQSVIDKPIVLLTPLEKARLRECQNVFNYRYLGRSSKDVAALRELKGNQIFQDTHMRESAQYLRQLIIEQYSTVKKFLRMMHARDPMYNRNQLKYRSYRTDRFYRIQYQTRRDCFRMLREVRQRRKEQNIERLTDYVEYIMSTYIDLKTYRILPWKFEFINEVYNILALAHIDRCKIMPNIDYLDEKNRHLLYRMPTDRSKDNIRSIFGHNAYTDLQKTDERHSRISQKLDNLEDRLRHSRYAIERCYLLFEMARKHFMESRFDKCLTIARKAISEARSCENHIWRFNSSFLVCQVHATLNRLERLKESLIKATKLATELRSPKLLVYLSICTTVNDHELGLRRMRNVEQNLRTKYKKKRGSSTPSVTSLSHNHSSNSIK